MARKGEGIVVPKFQTEAEEAQWWYDNREKVEDLLIYAMDNGTSRRGTPQRLTSGARASRNVAIRMAEEKGLPQRNKHVQPPMNADERG
jgi:hypothetical protein